MLESSPRRCSEWCHSPHHGQLHELVKRWLEPNYPMRPLTAFQTREWSSWWTPSRVPSIACVWEVLEEVLENMQLSMVTTLKPFSFFVGKGWIDHHRWRDQLVVSAEASVLGPRTHWCPIGQSSRHENFDYCATREVIGF